MSGNFDHGRPELYFNSGFIKNHIHVGSSRDKNDKKKAENVFLRRGVRVSTVLCLTRLELVRLAGEVHRRQEEYSRRPNATQTTQLPYDYWARGGERGKDKQRAAPGNSRFRYAVRPNRDGVYVMHHFDGLA